MDEIVTDPNDTKSLPLQVSGSLNDLRALLTSDSAGPNIMLQPDPFVARIHALMALATEINRTLPPQVVSRNGTTASTPPGVLRAGNEAITSPRPQSLHGTAGDLQRDIIQVTAEKEAAAPPPTHSPPADHPWLPQADDSWYVRIQKEQIAAQPEDQREGFYNAIMQDAAEGKAAQPEGRQGERSPLPHNSQADPPLIKKGQQGEQGPGTGGASIVCIDCGLSFTPNGYIQRRMGDVTYQAPKCDAKCRAERRRLFSGAIQHFGSTLHSAPPASQAYPEFVWASIG